MNREAPYTDLDGWMSLRYGQLLARARGLLDQRGDGIELTASDLVHDAYLRMHRRPERLPREARGVERAASRVMLEVVIDAQRRRGVRRAYRPEGSADDANTAGQAEHLDLVEALDRLERSRPAHRRLLHLRYFEELTLAECSSQLGRSVATLKREISYARGRLRCLLENRRSP